MAISESYESKLSIGCELKPHYEEVWFQNTYFTIEYENGGVQSTVTDTRQLSWYPGRGTNEKMSPEHKRALDTLVELPTGAQVSIQQDCNVNPTITFYPQDGSKYHVDVTGNVSKSIDVSKTRPYTLICTDSVHNMLWSVIFELVNDYVINVTVSRVANSMYTISCREDGLEMSSVNIPRSGSHSEVINDNTVYRYDAATDSLTGYDAGGNVDFYATLSPITTQSGEIYYGAFTPSNFTNKLVSAQRQGTNMIINIQTLPSSAQTRYFEIFNNGIIYGTATSSSSRTYDIPTKDVISANVLIDNIQFIQGCLDGSTTAFDAVTYKTSADAVRQMAVFNDEEIISTAIGSVPVRINEYTFNSEQRVKCDIITS